MKKRAMLSMVCLMLVAVFTTIFSVNNIYAAGETKDITFEDQNFYNAMKEKFSDKISSFNDETKTVTMTQENIEGVTTIDFLKKEITSIKGIENFTNLTNLDLSINQISDISALSDLTNLNQLSLSNNQISDISAISGLTKLTILFLENNQISDISALSGLSDLIALSVSYNQISDISALSGLTNLFDLHLDNNQISDASLVDNLSETITSISGQNINLKTNNTSVELPKIFLQAKDKNSKLYTTEDYILENCTLSGDGKSVILNEGAQNVSITISGGVASDTKFNISTSISTNKLELSLSQTPENLTNQNVVVTITSNKAVKPIEGWTLSEDKMTLTREYEKNTTEEISVTDEDGNVEKVNVNITNIDRDAPVIEYSTQKTENGGIEVTLKANEKVKPIEGWTLSEDEMTLTKTYTEAATEKLKISDIVGNEAEVTVEVIAIGNDVEIKDVDVENSDEVKDIEEVKNENNNPKTGDIIVYVGLVLSIAVVVLIVSKKYTKKENRI